MAIKRHKRGGRVYQAEYKSERVNGKVKSTYVRYIGVEGEPKIPSRKHVNVNRSVNFSRTTQSGDVTVLWHLAEQLKIREVIDRMNFGSEQLPDVTPGKIISIFAINRVIDPESATQISEWVRFTDLPLLSGIAPESFSKDIFLESLDFICYKDPKTDKLIDKSPAIEDEIYQHWRHSHPLPSGESEVLAYDMTAVLFHGDSCPISDMGYNSEHIRRKQVNLAILVSKFDKYPIAHFIYPGNRQSITTVDNLFCRLSDISVNPGTVIWDRGNVSDKSIKTMERLHWEVICGLPKTSIAIRNILLETDVPLTPQHHVKTTVCGHIYAKKVTSRVFGKMRSITVYANKRAGAVNTEDRNSTLIILSEKLDELLKNPSNFDEKKLKKVIKSTLNSYYQFFSILLECDNSQVTGKWDFNNEAIEKAQKADGKWAILSTNDNLSASEVVEEYFGKDFIEKKFQNLKSEREIMPVRHRLEERVMSIISVNVLSLRILAALNCLFKSISPNDTNECVSVFLKKMNRVQRTEVTIDGEPRTVYLNLTPDLLETLKIIGLDHLFASSITT